MILIILVLVVIALAVAMLLTMKQPKSATQADTPLESPTIEEGINIPVLFGSRMIKSPRIATWGDLKILKVQVDANKKK